MNSTTKPSFATCYYIRSVLLKYADELKWIVSQKSGFCINSETELEQLLESVYLEEMLEKTLLKIYKTESQIFAQVQNLEKLAQQHQALVAKNLRHSPEFAEVKRQIFWTLGFKRVVVKIEDLVNALNQLSQFSDKYLGTTLTVNNWQTTRPKFDWLNNFQVHRSADITFADKTAASVSLVQLQETQEWVAAFIQRSSQIIRDFATIIEQKRIGELPEGILLTRADSYSSWLTEKSKAV